MSKPKEDYLGDGLYARDDGLYVWLRAPRLDGDHEVALDAHVLQAFMNFLERTRNLKITVGKREPEHVCGDEDEVCQDCCPHEELDHGVCCDCGVDRTDELAARAEFQAELAEDR